MSYINAHVTPRTTEAKGNWAGNCPSFLAGAKNVRPQMARKQRQTHSLLTAHTKAKQKSQKGKRRCDLRPSQCSSSASANQSVCHILPQRSHQPCRKDWKVSSLKGEAVRTTGGGPMRKKKKKEGYCSINRFFLIDISTKLSRSLQRREWKRKASREGCSDKGWQASQSHHNHQSVSFLSLLRSREPGFCVASKH